MPSTASKIHAKAVGRRKSSSASVRLMPGDGSIMVNNRPIDQYFPGLIAKHKYSLPFKTVGISRYSASIKVSGGGFSSQLDAAVLGLSRALVAVKESFKPALRKEGLLTRDPRVRQRRMIGTGGKSRRKKQSPKR